ncbi:MAG: hypothetical protein SFX18_11820 [Pirellulales bacterium]|nr:hypothetical protein [Pirellulales bacterium]
MGLFLRTYGLAFLAVIIAASAITRYIMLAEWLGLVWLPICAILGLVMFVWSEEFADIYRQASTGAWIDLLAVISLDYDLVKIVGGGLLLWCAYQTWML